MSLEEQLADLIEKSMTKTMNDLVVGGTATTGEGVDDTPMTAEHLAEVIATMPRPRRGLLVGSPLLHDDECYRVRPKESAYDVGVEDIPDLLLIVPQTQLANVADLVDAKHNGFGRYEFCWYEDEDGPPPPAALFDVVKVPEA